MEAVKPVIECIFNPSFLLLIVAPISIGLIQLARSNKSKHVSHHPMPTVGTPRKPIM